MAVGLIDVDSHNFPNLPLMKLSAWHKAHGDQVEWWNGLKHYDRVYMSKVFDDTYSQDEHHVIMADEVIKGGTGYCIHNRLPDEVEHTYPDYSLYGITDKAYGFLTRGCPRHCPFCIVSEKEGRVSKQVAELSEFYRGEQDEIILLDPNITACKDSEKLFEELIQAKAKIEFNQGIDVRTLTDKHCEQLNRMRTHQLHMAWDNYEFKTYDKLKMAKKLLAIPDYQITVYVLTNYNTTLEQDLERIAKLHELNYRPYVMIYDKPNAPKKVRKMQRWCNAFVYKVSEFKDYSANIATTTDTQQTMPTVAMNGRKNNDESI